ncbi:MAG: hypothetical protein BWX99_02944 [Deltaproteobacteria bacterium ADurb.Bin151]|jgi:hypothetical protein|nr:DUF4126 domain-containing protein [Smithella sp.]OQB50104.1 MAG: hypothetical protein BWX99_02944 [Deltaproteobacteria bacterium ADurb.Bin151]HOQ43206.1 DUF4126 domain-containing protein [Smithellaceae bacterium]HPL66015.1 DUF4126 domain-containing protein [Smithellaceae bacterium]HQP25983.1 DUF4126 domain-containing protein [Smithellaceae bacterium]
MENIFPVAIGIGLAAACGFRVFVPLLILNLAALSGHLTLPADFAWIGGTYATMAFATATVLEIIGYYIPWLDHVLDTIATPAAVIAGTVTTAAVITDITPFLKWTMALIAGGGIAGLVQASTVAVRAKSTIATGGTANPIFSTMELAGSIIVALLAVFVPILVLVLVGIFLIWIVRKILRRLFKRANSQP